MDKRNLKIEVRAVIFLKGHDNRVLEYRLSPDQELTEKIEPSNALEAVERIFLPWKYEKKYDSYWIQPKVFQENIIMGHYEFENDWNWGPVWVRSQKQFEEMKEMFKTYGDLEDWFENRNQEGRKKWAKARDEYLKKEDPWY